MGELGESIPSATAASGKTSKHQWANRAAGQTRRTVKAVRKLSGGSVPTITTSGRLCRRHSVTVQAAIIQAMLTARPMEEPDLNLGFQIRCIRMPRHTSLRR